jgi:large subunit ribosomal protein L35
MPKLKTHRGTAKRIKISPRGKLLREQANHVHFNEKKGEGRKRRVAGKAVVSGAIASNLKRAMGV